MRLGKIPADMFAAFVENRFRKSGITPRPVSAPPWSTSAATCQMTQRLAHEAWDDVTEPAPVDQR
jgi:hypothetical protein